MRTRAYRARADAYIVPDMPSARGTSLSVRTADTHSELTRVRLYLRTASPWTHKPIPFWKLHTTKATMQRSLERFPPSEARRELHKESSGMRYCFQGSGAHTRAAAAPDLVAADP